jgi:hypothetical protein
MKTIDNLNITSITFREYRDLYGSGKEYKKRLNLPVEDSFNEKLKSVANEIGIRPTELIRQSISLIIEKCEDLINENDY